MLGVNYFSVYRLIQRNQLKVCRALRGKLLVPRTELLKLLGTEGGELTRTTTKDPHHFTNRLTPRPCSIFAEHLKQFKANCDVLHSIENGNPAVMANDASGAALHSSGRAIQTDDGVQWQHAVDLTEVTSVCHRRTAAGLEFAIVECLPLKSGEKKDVLNSGLDAQEVLQAFTRDQRQVLNLWKEDVKAQVREHLDQQYPRRDMGLGVESFVLYMARAIARREALAQSHGQGIRI